MPKLDNPATQQDQATTNRVQTYFNSPRKVAISRFIIPHKPDFEFLKPANPTRQGPFIRLSINHLHQNASQTIDQDNNGRKNTLHLKLELQKRSSEESHNNIRDDKFETLGSHQHQNYKTESNLIKSGIMGLTNYSKVFLG